MVGIYQSTDRRDRRDDAQEENETAEEKDLFCTPARAQGDEYQRGDEPEEAPPGRGGSDGEQRDQETAEAERLLETGALRLEQVVCCGQEEKCGDREVVRIARDPARPEVPESPLLPLAEHVERRHCHGTHRDQENAPETLERIDHGEGGEEQEQERDVRHQRAGLPRLRPSHEQERRDRHRSQDDVPPRLRRLEQAQGRPALDRVNDCIKEADRAHVLDDGQLADELRPQGMPDQRHDSDQEIEDNHGALTSTEETWRDTTRARAARSAARSTGKLYCCSTSR